MGVALRFLVFLVVVGLALAWLNDWPRRGDQSRVYAGVCIGNAQIYESCNRWPSVNQIKFHVNRELHTVSWEYEEIGPDYNNTCEIQDAENWQCPEPSPSGMFGGKMMRHDFGNGAVVLPLPKWKWAWLRYVNRIPAAKSTGR